MSYLFVATPCYGGVACVNYVISIMRLQAACKQAGMPVEFNFRYGESLISRARNECVAQFFEYDVATHLMFIDADIGFSPESVFRLARSGYEIAAGVYPLKCDAVQFPVDYDALDGPAADGFIKARMATTGFMCIARSALERIRDERPDLRYENDAGDERFAFFDAAIDPDSRRYLSEDYGFCQIWGQMGGAVYLDSKSNLSHQGYKLYSGNFSESLRERLT